ncbi:hypothetical protein IWQ62_001982 [Dispira parvispora]|uniref:Flavin reductase like domain-containing protein n=1 Tax=Dispira parvispora TaxID=1520584 RepID=A0A9W8AX37_9FUNG|nr:hypothetical protein IWQ62_001982 [Dispira parvispora]
MKLQNQLTPLPISTLCAILSAVVVLTTYDYTNGRPMGMTVGSFSSVSLKPPIVSFNIRNPSRFGKVLHSNHITPTNSPDDVLQSTVGINILSHTQAIVSDLFASPQFQYNPTHDPFQSLPHALLSPDCPVPLLQDTVGGFVGSTGKVVTVGDHDVWFVWLTDVWNRSILQSGNPESGGKPGPKTTPRTPSPLFLKSSRVSDELATEMLDTDLSVHTEPALLYCNRVYRSLSENTSPISTKTDSDSTDDI